jgi:octaprenyl-diphosphate synthase
MTASARHVFAGKEADSFLTAVEDRLETLLEQRYADADSAFLERAAGHVTFADAAKRARPRLVFHFGRAVDADLSSMVNIAAAAELVHTASLLHDDVVDTADERRGRTTVNTEWDNVTAILSGDLLLCFALQQLDEVDPRLVPSAVKVVEEMSRGIMLEVRSRKNLETTPAEWSSIAAGKTAALFGWCGGSPAKTMDDEDAADRFRRCGRHLGIAFQLADDLRDLLDSDSGKDRFADIRNGHPSHLLIWAARTDDDVYERLDALWSGRAALTDDAVEEAAEAVLDTGAPERTRAALRQQVDRALEALGSYADRPGVRKVAGWADQLAREF